MKIEILAKKSGARRAAEDIRHIALDQPSVIFLKLAPEKVARYERRGDDLVLVLQDGQEIAIPGFFVKYADPDSAAHGQADAAADGTPAEDGHGRNELVLEDDNDVAWWGQYPDEWTEFHFTEIEWDDAGFVWWPWLLGALGGAAAVGALAGGSGGKPDDPNRPPDAVEDRASGSEDGGPITGKVLTNDSDPDGDPLAVTKFTIGGTTYNAGDTATIAGVGKITLGSDGSYSFTPDANWNGTVPTVTYTVSDGKGGTDTAVLVITVTPVADLTAADDSAATQEDTPVSGTVATNDSSTSGGGLTFAKASDPSHGTVVVHPDGTYAYTPAANYSGPDSFTYMVSDPASGESLIRTVNITVTPVDDLTAAHDSAATQEDTPVSGTVATNDGTTSGGDLTFAKAGDPSHGTVIVNLDGTYTYTPASNYHGPDSFTYTVTDAASGERLTRTVTITVNPAVDLAAADDSAVTDEDTPVSGTVATNDSTTSGGDLSFAKASDPSHGTVAMNPDGSYTYTPDANYNGPDSFTYTVTDPASGESLTRTVNITVNPVVDLIAAADSATTDEETPVSGTVASNDSTTSGGDLTFAKASDPSHGAVVVNPDGSYTYTPDANYNGPDSFTYTVTDPASGESRTQTVTITVNPVDDLTAADDSATTDEDTPVSGTVATNDSTTSGGDLSFAKASDPSHGTVVMSPDGSYTYTPDANYNGPDSFTYTVTDPDSGESLTRTVAITVIPVNDTPEAAGSIADRADADADIIAGLDLSSFFADVDGDALRYSASGLPAGLSIDPATGVVSGTIDRSASQTGGGVYGVTVTATDGDGLSVDQSFTWTVTNPAPDASDDAGNTLEDTPVSGNVLGNDGDPDGDALTVTQFIVAGDPAVHNAGDSVAIAGVGTFTLDDTGAYSFIPAANWNGTVPTITYTISDGEGGTDTADLVITVTPVNDAPEAAGSIADRADADADTLAGLDVSGFFADLDGDTLSYSASGLPAGLSIDPVTGVISGTIDNSASQTGGGVYGVTVTATDGDGLSVDQTFTWTVTNPAPDATDDAATTDEDIAVSGNVLTNDGDPDGDALTVTRFTVAGDPAVYNAGDSVAIAGVGTFTLDNTGAYSFTPAANWHGTVPTVTYTVSDGEGGSDTADLVITVTPVNDAPAPAGTIADQADADADNIAPLDITSFFTDVEGDTLSYSASGLPAGLSIDPVTGVISGTIDRSASQDGTGGVYGVTVTATDGDGLSVDQSFTWTVTNPAPTANDDAGNTLEDTPVSGNVLTNDSDPDGDTLTVTSFTVAGDGAVHNAGDSVTVAGVGTFTLGDTGAYGFTPAANWNGTVPTVTYTVSDGEGGTDTADLVITVTPVNDAPVIAGGNQAGAAIEAGNLDDGTVVPGTPDASGSFAATDVDGDTLSWSIVGTPDATYGAFSLDPATGAWSYALNNGLAATQALNEGDTVGLTYTVQASDGRGGTATRTVSITITGTNDSPVANADTGAVTEAGVLGGGNTGTAGIDTAAGNVLGNDTDVDDGEKATLAVSAVGFGGSAGTLGAALAGTYGSLVLRADGTYTYTLDNTLAATQALRQGATATEAFTYTAVDVNGATSPGTLTITVTGTNDRPVITSAPAAALGEITERGTVNPGAPETASGTLTAADVDSGATQAWSLASANGAYGTISIDPVTGEWTYTLDNSRPATQALNDGETKLETFRARVTDEFGAYSEQDIVVTVKGSNDDLTGAGNATVTLAEDGGASGTLGDYVSDVDDVLKVTGFEVDADGDGIAESHAPGAIVTLRDAGGNLLGTLTIAEDGGYDFTPAANYAGHVPTITYTIAESGGGTGSVTQTLDFTITKAADAPLLEAAKTVATAEDNAVSLGLKAPVIADTGTGSGNDDYPERIGEITLTIGGAGAGGVTLSTGGTTLTPVGGKITIVLTDVPHVTDVPAANPAAGVYHLTRAEYEALAANPAAESGRNFTVTVGATSYEVDGAGAAYPGVAGASGTQVIGVDVQAVTDGAGLTIDGGTSTSLTGGEDGVIDLTGHLAATLNNGDGNAGADTDGSETYWYTVAGLPVGTIVTINGVATTISAGVPTASSPVGSSAAPPTITVKPPLNYSGDINGVTITLNARDTDGDSSGTIATLTSPVTLDLHITPVAGDVVAGDVTTPEDTAVAFLAGVGVTDTGSGSEVIDAVSFTVPAGWTVTAPTASAGWTYGLTGSTATISFDSSLTEAQREAILDGFTIRPPAHGSTDATITLSITTTDSNMVNGAPASDTQTVNRDVRVAVTPVAEQVGQDSDGTGGSDVTMIGDHAYAVPGREDTWFALGQNYTDASNAGGGWDLVTGWANADADEFTYAVLSPTLESDTPGDSVIGAQFRYSTDGGASWQTQTYTGDAIWVPRQYLDTLQVKLPPDVAGTLTIGVKAGTVDYDDDADVTTLPLDPPHESGPGVNVAISGDATLSLIKFDPVADAVTMALNGRAAGLEDTAIPLAIRTTSSDTSESFNVTISGIPAGAKIVYNGAELTIVGGSVTIAGFSNSLPLTITPPAHSNDNFQLTVAAVSVDGVSTSAPVLRTIDVSVTGVADTAVVTLPATSYGTSEAALDSGGHRVALSDVVTGVATPDNDGSEVVTLRITGLAEGFAIAGATTVVSGTGMERVWVVAADKLADVSIILPPNYSGTVGFRVAGVTTENDGDSHTAALTDVSFTVTPSPEATMTTSATLVEDQVTPLGLAIVHQNGDTDEVLGNVYVRVDYAAGADYTLYLGGAALPAGASVTTIGGVDYYVIPADQVAELGARGASNLDGDLGSLAFLYEVIDPSSDGSLPAATGIRSGSLALTATPVTDAVDASITAIAMNPATGTASDAVPGDDAAPDTATVTQSGSVTVNLHVDSADSDGSEHLVRVLIEGVPDGVTVTGASQVGTGSWLLIYDGGNAKSIGAGGIDVPVEFVVGRGAGNGASDIRMTVLAQDEGQSATTPAGIQTDSVDWHLVLNLSDGAPFDPPTITEWRYNGAVGTEDTGFALGNVIDASVSTSDSTLAYSYTVAITDLPAGSIVNGMILTTINGVPTWTATVTVPAGGDSQTALDGLLAGITITPPANGNDNNADFRFDAKLTAAAVGGTSVEADTAADMPVTPVTDEATIIVATSDIGEGATSLSATITARDLTDGVHGQIVDGKLYVQVTTHGNDGGTVTDGAGNLLVLTPVSGVAGVPDGNYYVIDVGAAGGSVELTYTAAIADAVLQPGDVTFAAWAQTLETGASNSVTASAVGTADVLIINNGVRVQSQPATGFEPVSADKSNAIPLNGLAVAVNDTDGSETIRSILLSGLPVGFLLYVGNTPGDATLAAQASNAGGDGTTNTWVLSADGALPAYIAILPPPHWSGEISGLALVVESGEISLPTTMVDTVPLGTVTVTAVADGLTIDPTLSFGTEGRIIDLNLNASMADPVAASASLMDGSIETTTLQVTGLGEHAAFYMGDILIEGVGYDDATDTYTITGLSQDALDTLGFVQAASALTDQDGGAAGTQVTVTAWTVESAGGAESGHVSSMMTLAVTPVLATTGSDSFIWDDRAINGRGGVDTVALRHGEDVTHADLANLLRNIEVIDLSAPGANSITGGLSIADVLKITGSSSGTLTIDGDADDMVQLSSGTEWSTNGVVTDHHVTYTSTSGVTLLIDEDIYNNGHVSYAA